MFHGSTVLGPIIGIGIDLRRDITTRSTEVEVALLADKESLKNMCYTCVTNGG